MSLISTILKAALPTPDIESFDRFLFVGPHPDDIEIGCGATVAKLASMGKKITFAICTDGRYGEGFTPLRGDLLVEKRKEEAQNSAKDLGVNDVRFLGLCDGGYYDYPQLEQLIAQTISNVNPDIVFCPDPSISSECHADHLNVGNAAERMTYFAPYESIMKRRNCSKADVKAIAFYYTSKTNKYVNTSGFFNVQLNALFKNHISQFPKGSDESKAIETYLKLRAYNYGVRNFCKTAEGFRVLTQTQMHCLSEFGD